MGQEYDDYAEPGEEPQRFVWTHKDTAAVALAGIVLLVLACIALADKLRD